MEKRHGPHPAQTVRRSSDRACRFLQSSGWGDRAAKNTRVDQSEAASSAGRPRRETSREMAQVQAASPTVTPVFASDIAPLALAASPTALYHPNQVPATHFPHKEQKPATSGE